MAGEYKFQSAVVEDGLSTQKLFDGDIVYDFIVKTLSLLGAYDPFEWNSGFLCRRLISDTMGKFIGGIFLPGERFIIISTFPVERQVEILFLEKHYPVPKKIAAIRRLARRMFSEEKNKPGLQAVS